MEKAIAKAEAIPMPASLIADADEAKVWEHALDHGRALRLYSRGVWFAVIVSLALVMEGFDTKIMGSLYAIDAFHVDFGELADDGTYQIPASWQSILGTIMGITSIGAMFLGGWATERFGFRKTMLAALASMPPIIFGFFFAQKIEDLAVATFFFAWPIGIFQTVTTVYVAEITPNTLRPYLTSCYALAWALGQLLNAAVFRGTLALPSPWIYRVPFALQWIWPLPLFIGVYYAPESPWWLVRQGRVDEAQAVLSRITSDNPAVPVPKLVALMVYTTAHERTVEAGTSYLACFKGAHLRRTVVIIGVFIMQLLSGAPLRAWMTYFFQQAGLPTEQSFNLTIVALVLSVLGVLSAWVVMTYAGRRTMYLWGNLLSMLIFIAIGALGIRQKTSSSDMLGWGIGSLLAIDGFIASLLLLPVSFVLISEIPSTLLRTKSIVIAHNSYMATSIVVNNITPYMINPTAWDWGALTGFFWAGASAIGLAFTFFMIPESKGRTSAEMDILFEQRTHVRKFKTADINFAEVEENSVP
ncbi:general substrate transporter [Plectosphaerella plurivora]|uniref:General substrate transporter n=1 Tax=Plectosphaerella plurivora TaxID=936078 RepID=A0A9P8V6R1_9PEZI|nr:general substrate transporter [Plectosphaerella plurivora]